MKQLTAWFLSLSLSGKILFIAVIGWCVTYQVMAIKLSLSNRYLIDQITEEKKIVNDRITSNESSQDSVIKQGGEISVKVQKEIKSINQKSKEYAKKIDNSDYPISKLDSLLSSYD